MLTGHQFKRNDKTVIFTEQISHYCIQGENKIVNPRLLVFSSISSNPCP